MPLSPDEVAAAYEQHERAIRAYCIRRLGDQHAGEDAAGAVWEELVRLAPSYEDRGRSVSALLFRIAHSTCVDHVRYAVRHPASPCCRTAETPVRDDVDGRLDALALLAELARTRPDYAAVLLAKAAGVTDPEIARRLGISWNAAKALAHRARAVVLKQRSYTHGQ